MPLPSLHSKFIRHSSTLDTWRRYLTDSPTPERIAATLRATDTGDIAAAIELNEEMESKDAHLQGVANTRRLALTALPWDIVPDADAEDQAGAEEAATYVRERLRTVGGWEDGLVHLSTAIGPGMAVLELVWNRGELVEVVAVPGHRLIGELFDGSGVTIETDEQRIDGVQARNPKFVVFMPSSRAGFPLRVTITRAQSYLWIIKHFSIADWSSFLEVFGTPFRSATMKPGAAPGEQDTVAEMLKNMGSDTWGVFSENVDVKFLEANRGVQPYEGMVDWIERKQSILYLGQTLTTEQGTVGSLALGQVHDSVRAALTLNDIKLETTAVKDQILKWMVRFRFPDRELPVPIFRRNPVEQRNIEADRLEMDKLKFMAERGLPVDSEVVYERLNIPQPKRESQAEPARV